MQDRKQLKWNPSFSITGQCAEGSTPLLRGSNVWVSRPVCRRINLLCSRNFKIMSIKCGLHDCNSLEQDKDEESMCICVCLQWQIAGSSTSLSAVCALMLTWMGVWSLNSFTCTASSWSWTTALSLLVRHSAHTHIEKYSWVVLRKFQRFYSLSFHLKTLVAV